MFKHKLFLILFQVFTVSCAPRKNIITNTINTGTTGCPSGSACVAFNLCKDDVVVKDGGGLMDIRYDDDETPGECFNYYEICCKVYDDISASESSTSQDSSSSTYEACGVSDMEAVNLKITEDKDSETKFGEFPWMIAILTEESIEDQIELNVYQCGGSLIHPKVVLTAAHCVVGRVPETLKIRAGEWDTQMKIEAVPHQDRFVSEIKIHEDFNRHTLYHDVALLIAVSSFDLAQNVRTICLPQPETKFKDSGCIATGWGKDDYGRAGKYSNVLKKVDLPLVSHRLCETLLRSTRLGSFFELHNSFLCAGGERGKDTCKGDGGSPLICPIDEGKQGRFYQAGVVAWGIGCGNSIPAVYASVAQARQWIDKQFLGFNLDKRFYTF